MKKKTIDFNEYAGVITKALPAGILLTTKAGEKVNTMMIGWGTIGVNWGLPVFAAYVRDSRFTKQMLEENPCFTVNVPFEKPSADIVRITGALSGRDIDKIAEANLTLTEPSVVNVPGIREFPLTLECKVIYEQREDINAYSQPVRQKYYPVSENGEADIHTVYYGEIVSAYIIEDD